MNAFKLSAIAAAFAAATPFMASQALAGAILTNGTVTIGVNDEGHLNTPFSPDPLGIGFMGLRYNATGAASTEPGCQCEGWGVSNGTRTSNANVSVGGVYGMSLISFTSTDGFTTNATSKVKVTGSGSGAADTFEVTHAYHPSASANLYQVDVSIKNISGVDQTALYRRVMDWDIYPTPFSEFVTIVNSSPTVFRTDTNGFNAGDPLSFSSYAVGPSASNGYTNIIDSGPADHGALFDFDFGVLSGLDDLSTVEDETVKNFTTFYGAGADMAEVIAALTAVGAENVYSLGKCNPAGDPSCTLPGGAPNTFVFAFKGVGGTVVGLPEPGSLALLGLGLAGLALRKRKTA